MIDEQWRVVVSNENYEVSDIGRVRRISSGRILKPILDSTGYYTQNLSLNGKQAPVRVHRLVAEAFVSQFNITVNHKDGDKLNNHPDNLEWVTRSENFRHAHENGLSPNPPKRKGEAANGAKLTEAIVLECRRRHAEGSVSLRALSREYGVCRATISCVIKRSTWAHI